MSDERSRDLRYIDRFAQKHPDVFDLGWHWLLGDFDGILAMVPLADRVLSDCKPGSTKWDIVMLDLYTTLVGVERWRNRHKDEWVSRLPSTHRALTLYDDGGPVPRLHGGHFKPELTPGGLKVLIARFAAKPVARI